MILGSRTRWTVPALGAFLLSGCSNMVWVRPNTEPVVVSNQLDECRKLAHLSAIRMGTMGAGSIPLPITSASGATTMAMPNPGPASDPVEEQAYLNKCMRDKGYTLVPVK